jgi:hypothetical protein
MNIEEQIIMTQKLCEIVRQARQTTDPHTLIQLDKEFKEISRRLKDEEQIPKYR